MALIAASAGDWAATAFMAASLATVLAFVVKTHRERFNHPHAWRKKR